MPRRSRLNVFPGWVVVAVAFVMLAVSSGLGFYGLAIYLRALVDERHFTTTQVSLGTSLFFVVSGIGGRLIARRIDRRDLRPVVVAGGVVGAVALVLLGHVRHLWQLYPVYSLLAIGFAGCGLVPATTVITRWFHRRRAVALSIASTGLSVGGLTLTKWAADRIDRHGLAASTPWLGAIWLVLVVLLARFLWPNPMMKGTAPDGEAASATTVAASAAGVPYERAIHTRFFVMFTLGYIFVMGAQVGGIAQLAKLGQERVDKSTGTLAVSVLALASVIARLLCGLIVSRVPMRPFTVALAAGQGLSLLLLASSTGKTSLLVGAVLFGATVGNILMLQPLLIADVFGVRDYSRIYALNQLVTSIGVAAGPLLLGVLRDASSYRVSYVVAGVLSMSGALTVARGGSLAAIRQSLEFRST